jgi:hypothetical protein
MSKKERLYKKIIRLWNQAGLPAYLHRYGPKKYKSVFLAFCWFITQKWTKSLRGTQDLLFEIGFPVPHWTTIQKAASRFSGRVWNLLHKMTILEEQTFIAAVDSTGFSLSNPSRHYTNVIVGKVKCPAKLSVLVDTRTSKALALRFRAKPAHDARDFLYLIKKTTPLPKKIVGDSAYDSEKSVFEPCFERDIVAVVKPCKNRKRGFYRHKMRKRYDLRTYHRRPVVEGFFSRLKQRFGGNLRCRAARTQRAEIYARVTLQNLSYIIQRLFLQHRSLS